MSDANKGITCQIYPTKLYFDDPDPALIAAAQQLLKKI